MVRTTELPIAASRISVSLPRSAAYSYRRLRDQNISRWNEAHRESCITGVAMGLPLIFPDRALDSVRMVLAPGCYPALPAEGARHGGTCTPRGLREGNIDLGRQ